MDPFTIAASVAKVTSTCLITGKAIYDFSCKYQDAPRNIITISTEATVISASLSHIQALILSKPNPEQLLRSRPEIAATLDTALTGCMVLFSCLDEELREVSRYAQGRNKFSWKGKVKTVWKQETFQELLNGLRGHQVAVNTLVQLLQMESLSEITQLLQQQAPELKKSIERTESLRRSYPSVRVAVSIYNQDDRMSVYSAADSIMASSDFEFDFDDIIVNSAAYRRALAVARHRTPEPALEGAEGDLIDFTDGDTIRERPTIDPPYDIAELTEDLVGLHFSGTADIENNLPRTDPVPESSFSSEKPGKNQDDAIKEAAQGQKTTQISPERKSLLQNVESATLVKEPTPSQQGEDSHHMKPTVEPPHDVVSSTRQSPYDMDPVTQSFSGKQSLTLDSLTASQPKQLKRYCYKCTNEITGQFVRALGGSYHLECFTCEDCGRIVASKFFPDDNKEHVFCAYDYFKRSGLLCYSCDEPLEGRHIIALGRKYHLEHFTCAVCPTVFGPTDHYYDHENNVYCFYHYGTTHASLCNSCGVPVLEQFMDSGRDGAVEPWHPECYMIHKNWKVKMSKSAHLKKQHDTWTNVIGTELTPTTFRKSYEVSMAQISRTWSILRCHEEKVATFISSLLYGVSNGQTHASVLNMSALLSIAGVLFAVLESACERNIRHGLKRPTYSQEVESLCKKCVALMQLIKEYSGRKRIWSETLISLVTGLAHHWDLLIRIGLQGSQLSLDSFFQDMQKDPNHELQLYREQISTMTSKENDYCTSCGGAVEDACFRAAGKPLRLWHSRCLECPGCHRPGAFECSASTARDRPADVCAFCWAPRPAAISEVTQLKQSTHLLWVALARLMESIRMDFSSLLQVDMSMLEEVAARDAMIDGPGTPGPTTKISVQYKLTGIVNRAGEDTRSS